MRKVCLSSTPGRHTEVQEAQLHSFPTLALDGMSYQLRAAVALSLGNNAGIHSIKVGGALDFLAQEINVKKVKRWTTPVSLDKT
jgi:hypothetical protein